MKEEVIKVVRYVLVCALMCVFIACIVAGVLRTPIFVSQSTYLSRLLLSTLCCGVILLVVDVLFLAKKALWGISFSEYALCTVASVLFMALFFSLGPMTIERSYTIYSLADMTDHAEQSYTAEEVKRQFIEGYIEGADASQKRLDEQVAIGNVEMTDGKYHISEKGKSLVRLFRVVEAVFPVPDESSIYPNGK